MITLAMFILMAILAIMTLAGSHVAAFILAVATLVGLFIQLAVAVGKSF